MLKRPIEYFPHIMEMTENIIFHVYVFLSSELKTESFY